jgi:Flp pilus assembly protein TadD
MCGRRNKNREVPPGAKRKKATSQSKPDERKIISSLIEQTSSRLHVFLICAVLVLASIIAYEPVRHNVFLEYDDDTYVVENQHVNSGITLGNVRWAFTTGDVAYWHPVTWLSHMLDCQLYGLRSSMHHLTNLILHIVNSLLLFWVFKRMTGALWSSAFIGALFALHPLNVDSVAWLAERKNVLSTFFWLLTMLTYVHYSQKPGLSRYLPVVLLFAISLMAKPMLVTLPFVLLLLDYWPLGRVRFGRLLGDNDAETDKSVISGGQSSSVFRLVLEKVPLFVLSAASVCLSSLSFKRYEQTISTELVPMKLRIANALVSYVNYIGKMLWPKNLAVFYPYPETVPLWQTIGALLLLVCVSVPVIWLLRKKPYLGIGWLWFLGTLVPVIGLMQGGRWPAMADRFTYVPNIGLFIIIAWGVSDLLVKWRYRKVVLGISSGLVLAILLMCTRTQVQHWQNNLTLFGRATKVTKNNYIMHNNYGEALLRNNQSDEAIDEFHEALRLKPNYYRAHNNLGVACAAKAEFEQAIVHYNRALSIEPGNAEIHNNLGSTLVQQGKIDQAIEHFREVLQLDPEHYNAHNNMAVMLIKKNRIDEAIVHWTEALRLKPDWTEVRNNLNKLAMWKKRSRGKYIDMLKRNSDDPNI